MTELELSSYFLNYPKTSFQGVIITTFFFFFKDTFYSERMLKRLCWLAPPAGMGVWCKVYLKLIPAAGFTRFMLHAGGMNSFKTSIHILIKAPVLRQEQWEWLRCRVYVSFQIEKKNKIPKELVYTLAKLKDLPGSSLPHRCHVSSGSQV